ncbi:MAG: extracellular solute-binding protein [Dehalococcoidia bacterium]
MRKIHRRSSVKPVLGLMLALTLILSACGGGEDTPDPAAEEPADEEPTEDGDAAEDPEPTDDDEGDGTDAEEDAGEEGAEARDGMSMDELIAAAKEEGVVRVYTSRAEDQVQSSVAEFEEKYGIDVELYRAGGAQVAQRLELEMRSGRPGADVVHLSDASFHVIAAERGDFVAYVPTEGERVPDALKDANDYWYGTSVLGMPIIYNSEELTEEEAPKSYAELYGPDWASRAGIGSPNYGASQTTNAVGLLELFGEEIFDQMAENDTWMGQAWPTVENAIIAGELLVGQTASTRLEAALAGGQPLGWIEPEEGVIAGPAAIGILESAEYPNAARLWVEHELTDEGLAHYQSSWAALSDFQFEGALPPLDEMNMYIVDPATAEAEAENVREIFRSTLE